MSEELLKEYPESFKRVFGLDTASQADINKVLPSICNNTLVEASGDCA